MLLAKSTLFGLFFIVLAAFFALAPAARLNAQSDKDNEIEALGEEFFVAFNDVLRTEIGENGVRALARNEALDTVAQRLADEAKCGTRWSGVIPNMARDAGYGVYLDGASRTTTGALFTISSPIPPAERARDVAEDVWETNIDPYHYREMGVGVVPCTVGAGGTQQYAIFVILGSQPDVIPVVIENGATELETFAPPYRVQLSIHEENTRRPPNAEYFGKAEFMKINDGEVSAFQPRLYWMLEECGLNTITVELTDTRGNTVVSAAEVMLKCLSEEENTTPTPSPTPAR